MTLFCKVIEVVARTSIPLSLLAEYEYLQNATESQAVLPRILIASTYQALWRGDVHLPSERHYHITLKIPHVNWSLERAES
jgi:hypothetical protein